MKKIKTITRYAGLARFLAQWDDLPCGQILHPAEIKTPYFFGQTTPVFFWKGKQIIIPETAHRRYQVWEDVL